MGNTEQNDDSMVYSLDSKPFGLTYGDWTVEWWQWILSMPENINPLFDMTGERSNINQTKQVWFLAGTYQGEAQRTCTIPAGRAILFPVINIECSYTENPDIENDSELSASCKFLIDQVTKRTACLDGIILEDSRVQSQIFDVTFRKENIWEVEQGPTQAISDGYWVFLKPLPAGNHTIHFSGEASFSNYSVAKHVRYNLMVEDLHTEIKHISPSPPEIEAADKIVFNPNKMINDEYYSTVYKGNKYFLRKINDKFIDLYEGLL